MSQPNKEQQIELDLIRRTAMIETHKLLQQIKSAAGWAADFSEFAELINNIELPEIK